MDEIEAMVKDTVEQYYSMNEDQRNFVLDLIDKSETSWTRQQLMKALLLFNKSKELNCGIHDLPIDEYVDMIDKKGKYFHTLFIKYDSDYRKEHGVSDF
jgi:hypothetical protein